MSEREEQHWALPAGMTGLSCPWAIVLPTLQGVGHEVLPTAQPCTQPHVSAPFTRHTPRP